MQNIDIGLIALILIGVTINCLLLAWVIRASTQTKKRLEYDEIKIKLLIQIASKLGVSTEEIQDCSGKEFEVSMK